MSEEKEVYGERCSVCGVFYPYEDLEVVDTVPDDPDEYEYGIREILLCKYCKENDDR